jgi:hypothetical protein
MTDPGAARSARELVAPQRLRRFFAPRSIALVGASGNSGWARFIVASCATAGFAGLPLLNGLRGARPADLDAVAGAIAALGDAALSVRALRALEVNPLWVHGEQVEALDVLVVTGPERAKEPRRRLDSSFPRGPTPGATEERRGKEPPQGGPEASEEKNDAGCQC